MSESSLHEDGPQSELKRRVHEALYLEPEHMKPILSYKARTRALDSVTVYSDESGACRRISTYEIPGEPTGRARMFEHFPNRAGLGQAAHPPSVFDDDR